MPEGDTVFRTAARLNEFLSGFEITRFDIRVPGSATADLRGQVTREVVPRGKHLLHRIGDWTLHSHLRMEGAWQLYRSDARWRRPAFQARAVVGTADRVAVGFDLARVAVIPTAEEHTLVGHLGPDPLADDWDEAEAVARVSADPRPIHVALLDQRSVAGFGNEYVNEMLFVRGVDPHTPATDVDVRALIQTGARMMRANLSRVGRVFTGDARPGRTDWVFSRTGQPCRRCGTAIREDALGADPTRTRRVFWCPSCQQS